VSLEQLRQQLHAFGDRPFLVTVGAEGRGHVVSVQAQLDGSALVAAAGRTSRANIADNAAVTLLWSAPAGGPYSLIVDGSASISADDAVVVRPERAVLHRLAGAPDDLASCVRLEDEV
jgi:hypothetical protein